MSTFFFTEIRNIYTTVIFKSVSSKSLVFSAAQVNKRYVPFLHIYMHLSLCAREKNLLVSLFCLSFVDITIPVSRLDELLPLTLHLCRRQVNQHLERILTVNRKSCICWHLLLIVKNSSICTVYSGLMECGPSLHGGPDYTNRLLKMLRHRQERLRRAI